MDATKQPDNTPPYLPWTSFESFVGGLKSTAIPSRIDRSVLNKLNGSAQSQLRSALRYLGLTTGDAYVPTQRLTDLVEAHGTERWKATVEEVVSEAYKPIVGKLNMQSDTMAQLLEQFGEIGKVSGSVREKAVRFYLAALDVAGVKYSPHFKKGLSGSRTGNKTPRNGANANGARRSPRQDSTVGEAQDDPKEHANAKKIVVSMPTRDVTIYLPPDLSTAELTFLVDYLKRYQRLASGGDARSRPKTKSAPAASEEKVA